MGRRTVADAVSGPLGGSGFDGLPRYPGRDDRVPERPPRTGLAVTGLVFGVLGLTLFIVPGLGVMLGLLGLGFAIGSLTGARKSGLGIAGLVVSILSLVPAVIFYLIVATQ